MTSNLAQSAQPDERRRLLWQSLEAARSKARPLDQARMIAELARCLDLCAPSGMGDDTRTTWLLAAWAELSEMPAAPFLDAASSARKNCDHPAKIVPWIVRVNADWVANITGPLAALERQWANIDAPRLTRQRPDYARDRHDVAKGMSELVRKLQASINAA